MGNVSHLHTAARVLLVTPEHINPIRCSCMIACPNPIHNMLERASLLSTIIPRKYFDCRLCACRWMKSLQKTTATLEV